MIIYFSGTGNSRYIAEGLASLTGDSLTDATALIRGKEYPKLYSERPWVFVCPVYGWRIPHIFKAWIEKSGFSGSRSAYFIINCGGEIGNAARYLKPLCRAKKFELLGVREVIMPENYIAMFDAPDEETAARIRRTADKVIKKTAETINSFGRFPKKKLSFSDRFKSAVVNPFFYAFCVKSKKFRTTEMCVSCGKCAAECPMNGIELRAGKPVWTGKCTHCMACICGCPVSAIEYGKKSLGKVRYKCPPYGESAEKTETAAATDSAAANENAGENKKMLKHSCNFTLSPEDFDAHGNLLPEKILSMFQELADKHAVLLDVGFEKMLSRNLLWVITQMKYQVCGKVEAGTQLLGETWPLPPTRINYERQYLISDAEGNPIIKGTSIWVLIDAEKRSLAKASENVYPEGEYCTVNNFDERLRRIRDFESDGNVFDVCPDQTAIDKNGHVNNTKYAGFVLTALNDIGGEIDLFQIDYINEVMCGETVHIERAENDGTILVKGLSDEGKRMFACSIVKKQS